MSHPLPWQTRFAYRTYAAGALWATGLTMALFTHAPDHSGWLAIRLDAVGVLYLGASIVGGLNFMGAGVRAARAFKLDMNFLMSAAVVGAIAIGEPFEAATLAFLFSVAELLERYAVDRGRRSIELLVALAPEQAEQLRPDGTVVTVVASALRPGDVVRVRPGGKIPADGRVVAGSSAVNEATITGESMPRTRTIGDPVYASTLNAEGALDVQVTADAQHSTLARVIQLVREAESHRAPIEQFVKRFARIYTPVVVSGAVLVMLVPPLVFGSNGLEWFLRGLTLLVIACPCALVIATPVTVVSALTSAARHGVLIKGGEHLETLGAVRAIAFDKTGTLTRGALAVTGFENPADADLGLLRYVAAAESRSEHPIAKAIVNFAARNGVPADARIESFSSVTGQGVRARVEGIDVLVGTSEFTSVATSAAPEHQASTQVYARVGDRVTGFLVADEVRPEARAVNQQLRKLGLGPLVMLTGDDAATAQAVATATGVDEVRARLMPGDKVTAIRELRDAHGVVAMLGDGVNDAPALAAASVGLAMGAAGSPVAIETADIALMADDLSKLPYAVRLARRARHTVRFNIALALAMKMLLAIGAVSGAVSLAMAVLVGDMGGSLVVTLNALRIAGTPDQQASAGRN